MAAGIGIDIGASSIKAIRLEKKGAGFQVTGAVKIATGEIPVEDYNLEPQDALTLAQHLGAAGIRAKKSSVGVSGKDLMMRYVEVPPVPPWRLQAIMDFEIAEMANRAGGDVTSNFRLLDLPPNKGGNNIVLVSLAKNGYLERRIALLQRAKISVGDLQPASLALFRGFLLQGPPPPGETTLLVDVGARNTEMVIQRDGVLLFARNVSSGGNLFTNAVSEALRVPFPEAERIKIKEGTVSRAGALKATNATAESVYEALVGTAGQFAALIRSSIMFCRSQTKIEDLNLDRILLSGGGSRLKGLKENLSAAFKIPVETFSPLAEIPVVVDDQAQAEQITESPREMSIALGLAASVLAEPEPLRLLPERHQKRREFFERKLFLFGAGAAAVGFLALGMVAGTHNRAVAGDYHKQVNDSLTTARGILGDIEETKVGMERTERVLEMVRAEASSPARFLRVQAWIQGNMPDEMWLRQVELRRATEGTIAIGDASVVTHGVVEKTVANPRAVLTNFINDLRGALPGDVAEVNLSQTKEKEGNIEFSFEVKLKPVPPETKSDENEEEDDGDGAGRSYRRH